MTTELTNQVRKLADDDWLRGDYAKRLCAELTAAREEIARLREVLKELRDTTPMVAQRKFIDKVLGETHVD
jgi:hypothetical protein